MRDKLQDSIYDTIKLISGETAKGHLAKLSVDQKLRACYVAASKKPCILCQDAPDVVGNLQVGQEKILIFFSLCVSCKHDEGWEYKVGRAIEANLEKVTKADGVVI